MIKDVIQEMLATEPLRVSKFHPGVKFLMFCDKDLLYWEHLGMLGFKTYDERCSKKLNIYDLYFKDKFYEGTIISYIAFEVIEKLKLK
ncbi:hypothetical protein K0040_15410 [Terrisporobacter petrolearius]|uniref:hypothetical protein n=1 Tax=Terrisporobacter petrolearius TaxID=1460447 RepID=UPI001D164A02|nr:hypothetical protein [Terrisporobacter petrolearius]MCC3865650.1 hypothetical protein [Terrisporobacter petrolearius]